MLGRVGQASWPGGLIFTFFLAAYNDFLNPSRFEIRFAFTQLRLDVQVNALPCNNDFLLQKKRLFCS